MTQDMNNPAVKAKDRKRKGAEAEALAFKKTYEESVALDDDSMENIDSYWRVANRELDKMSENIYEDISKSAKKKDTGKKDAEAAGKEARGKKEKPRKRFDEEFEKNLDNAILTGFSDSSTEGQDAEAAKGAEKGGGRDDSRSGKRAAAKESAFVVEMKNITSRRGDRRAEREETKKTRETGGDVEGEAESKRKRSVRRMSFHPEPVEEEPREGRDGEEEEKRAAGKPAVRRRAAKKPAQEKEAADKRTAKGQRYGKKTEDFSILGNKETKKTDSGLIFDHPSMEVEKICIKSKRNKKLEKSRVYYVLKGSLVLSPYVVRARGTGKNSTKAGRNSADTRIKDIDAADDCVYKAGGIFSSLDVPVSALNAGLYDCVLLMIKPKRA